MCHNSLIRDALCVQRLIRLYETRNPSKIADAYLLSEEWFGNEDALNQVCQILILYPCNASTNVCRNAYMCMCMYMYMKIFMNMSIYKHICIYVYIYIYVHVYIYIYIYIYIIYI